MPAQRSLIVCIFCCLLPLLASAQDPVDSSRVQLSGPTAGNDTLITVLKQAPDPAKAAFYSAVLPGLGQAYNGSAWKIPLIYSGIAYVIYAVDNYNQLYSENLKSLRLLQNDPSLGEINQRNAEYYQRVTDRYRRDRDFSIIMGGVVYGLNIVEAYVDAHLQSFDLSEDLSLHVRPSLVPSPFGTPAAGLKVSLSIP
jgi:hypothetical protein